jgi:hypothetical protein
MMMIEISVAIEEELGVLMPDLDAKEAAHIKTVSDLVALVARKLEQQKAQTQTNAQNNAQTSRKVQP